LDIAGRNIARMAAGAKEYGLELRPHVKTHKSVYFARKQVEAGAWGITCAKPSEAAVFVEAGFDNVLVAHILLDEHKLAAYDALDSKAVMHTLVNSAEGAAKLSDYALAHGKVYNVFIEIDANEISRGGVKPRRPAVALAERLRPLAGIRLKGLMHYCGDIYGCPTDELAAGVAATERDDLIDTAKMLAEAGMPVEVLSAGSSFSCKHPDLLQGVTEMRAGNYIFNDCAQLSKGIVGIDDCALRVMATVIAKPDARNVIIDAGTKTLSSDTTPHRPGFGYVIGHGEITIIKMNEEHGYLRSEGDIGLEIGDRVLVIPNHACTVVNLADTLYGLRGETLEREIPVDARGKNY
jgi:D-serine deaminase-like pyridoxal phosphate-dependent protein